LPTVAKKGLAHTGNQARLIGGQQRRNISAGTFNAFAVNSKEMPMMSGDKTQALGDMTKEKLIMFFGSNAEPWALHGVGMLRSAYVMWGVFWDRSKRTYQQLVEAGGKQTVPPEEFLDMCADRGVHAYKLLAAVAMENLAKGLLVAKGEVNIENHRLPPWFLKHDIVRLVSQRAKIQLNECEKLALEDCTKAIIWQTRYPMPKDADCLPTQFPRDGFVQRYNHPTDFRNLATRILREYPAQAFNELSVSGLIQIVERECPPVEALKG
jgi:hypothetical protein